MGDKKSLGLRTNESECEIERNYRNKSGKELNINFIKPSTRSMVALRFADIGPWAILNICMGLQLWKGLQSIGMVESERRVSDKITVEQRYYLMSIESDARRFAQSVRSHWGIENLLDWVLDVSFLEDSLRGCLGYSAENLAVVRHLALNLLTHESTAKGGIHAKRLLAGWNNNYLSLVLNSLSPRENLIKLASPERKDSSTGSPCHERD